MLDYSNSLIVCNDVYIKDFPESIVLMSLKNSTYYSIENSSKLIFEMIRQGNLLGDCLKQFQSEYRSVPLEESRRDFDEFVSDLLRNNLVQYSNV